MRSLPSYLLSVSLAALLASTAVAQSSGINWRRDLASAQAEAQQTGKPILIHFWTPTCGPCKRLERTVFNQASVAQALESQFVPVKINAEIMPAVAQQYAVFQWPTDVITTPQGHAIGKMVSPPSPGAYISQISQVASRFKTRLGAGYDQAVAGATQPSQLNSAYAGLSLNASPSQANPAAPSATPVATTRATPVANPYFPGPTGVVGPPPVASPGAVPSAQPVARYQPNIQGQPNQQTRYAMAPAAAPAVVPAIVAPAAPPARIANPYYAAANTPAVSQMASQAPPQAVAPAATTPLAPASVASAGPPVVAANSTPTASTPTATPLGFDGFCPVSMKKDWRWIKGDPRWGIVHRGRTYLFNSAGNRDEFWKKPDAYSPALSGNDPVLAIDQGQSQDGTREHSLEYGGQFYMFATEASLQQFSANPGRYVAGVRQAMGLDASSTIRR